MYFYEIGCHSYESSPSYILGHELLFSKDEFDNLVSSAFVESYFILSEQNKTDDFFFEGHKYDYYCTPESLVSNVESLLIENHGFVSLKVECSFMPDGNASITENSRYQNDDYLSRIRNAYLIESDRIDRDNKIKNIII